MFGNPSCLIFSTHHEAGDVLQKHQGDFALIAQLDEVRPFHCRLTKQHTVVGDDAYRMPKNPRKAGDQCVPIFTFELLESASIHKASNHLSHVIRRPFIHGDHPVQLLWIHNRILAAVYRPRR